MLLHLTQNLKCILHDILTENVELKQQLVRKEAELTRAEETIRRKQQQILEMVGIFIFYGYRITSLSIVQGETIRNEQELVQLKEKELAQTQQKLTQQVSVQNRENAEFIG